MPGGLLQLVATGAQTQILSGNPTFTYWRSMYKRHTNFAMESVRLDFDNTTLQFPLTGGPSTFRCKIRRVTDLLHDCYLCFNLPDIWSPLYSSVQNQIAGSGPGYEFQWIENIGYNAIERISVLINGVKVYEAPGEWMKLHSYLSYDRNKREMIDQMVGNTPELTDPGNAYGRMYQYPHAVKVPPATTTGGDIIPEPSIRGRQIITPLHLWFCENAGVALPLIALQNGEVYIEVRLRPVYELFTVQDVKGVNTLNTGGRVAGDPIHYPINTFLSPPNYYGAPTNSTLANWFPDPYIEANYVYLTEGERAQVASADQSFLIRQITSFRATGQYGPADMELPMQNLVTRVVWVAQRSDRQQLNDYDNYTNWQDRKRRPIQNQGSAYSTPLLELTSGSLVPPSQSQKDILIESTILLDAKERFKTKNAPYFNLIQTYKHTQGAANLLPGIYMYSFALDHNALQPSGALNASQFNKILLRMTLIQPTPTAITDPGQITQLCVYKNTVFNPNPTAVPVDANGVPIRTGPIDPVTGLPKLALSPADTITLISRGKENVIYGYTYTVTTYVESINVLRVVSGLANLVFAK